MIECALSGMLAARYLPALKTKKAGMKPAFTQPSSRLRRYDILGLRTFLALSHDKRNLLSFGKGLEAATLDSAEVRKYIGAAFTLDKTEAFRFVEPLNGTAYCL